MSIQYNHDHENEITLFAETNFRNQRRRFGIKTDDRRRHVYIIGKTGMGKTVLQENMVMSDIMAGHGVCYIDPHGDTAEKILDYIPSNRINDVVYFNPADIDFPVGFNILETVKDSQKHLVASGLMGVFKKIWPDVWSARMEYILLNCVLALLDYPGATLLGINRLLVDAEFRTRVIAKIRDPIVKTFWVAEFTTWTEKYATEAIAPIQNKVGQFLSASIIRNIVSQVRSTVDIRDIMDNGKIFIVNLSKGRIGEENMRLLGGMIISRIQMAAMERVDLPESDRRDFYLFVDEFQNFANESFASILSEARKYHLNLTVAHQYIEQLTEEVRAAVIGNVGTLLSFRVGGTDATFLEQEFSPTFTPEDLVNLTKYTIYLKLMVDGVATAPFSATTLPPMAVFTGNSQKVVSVSRERYAVPRSTIEEKVLRWSGMETAPPAGAEEAKLAELKDRLGGVPESSVPKASDGFLRDTEKKEEDNESDGSELVEYLKISPERLKAIVKPPSPSGKKDKPKFSHTCDRCGKVWDMPIQLDTSRPIYCADCMPLVREERKTKGKVSRLGPGPDAKPEPRPAEPPRERPEKSQPSHPNRPRIVGDIRLDDEKKDRFKPPAPSASVASGSRPQGLMAELERIKGRALETSKVKLERMAEPNKQQQPSSPKAEPRYVSAPQSDVARTLTVFKSSSSPAKTPEPSRASTEYPTVPPKQGTMNPLDKRLSQGARSDAGGAHPVQDDPSLPKTLRPGQKITF